MTGLQMLGALRALLQGCASWQACEAALFCLRCVHVQLRSRALGREGQAAHPEQQDSAAFLDSVFQVGRPCAVLVRGRGGGATVPADERGLAGLWGWLALVACATPWACESGAARAPAAPLGPSAGDVQQWRPAGALAGQPLGVPDRSGAHRRLRALVWQAAAAAAGGGAAAAAACAGPPAGGPPGGQRLPQASSSQGPCAALQLDAWGPFCATSSP
jgi:hypothetical protein